MCTAGDQFAFSAVWRKKDWRKNKKHDRHGKCQRMWRVRTGYCNFSEICRFGTFWFLQQAGKWPEITANWPACFEIVETRQKLPASPLCSMGTLALLDFDCLGVALTWKMLQILMLITLAHWCNTNRKVLLVLAKLRQSCDLSAVTMSLTMFLYN